MDAPSLTREHSSSADQFVNEDSTSNQSDSSSSSANLMTRQKQVLHGNTSHTNRSNDEHEVKHTTKRTLTTKNVSTSEKRKRNVSGSGVVTIKREPQVNFHDDVRFSL